VVVLRRNLEELQRNVNEKEQMIIQQD